jgi:hypothetical protein
MLKFVSTILALLAFLYFRKGTINNMTDKATDWLQDKMLGWMSAPPTNKVDTHHHYVPSFYSNGMSAQI